MAWLGNHLWVTMEWILWVHWDGKRIEENKKDNKRINMKMGWFPGTGDPCIFWVHGGNACREKGVFTESQINISDITWRKAAIGARAWLWEVCENSNDLDRLIRGHFFRNIFVPSLSSETEPQSYGPTQQHQRLDLTVSLLITEQFRLHPLLLVRAVQQVHNSSYTPWSLLNSSFQPCIAFSEISDNEYNSLYL